MEGDAGMTTVLAIDPGNKTSGWVLMSGREILDGAAAFPNAQMLDVVSGEYNHRAEPDLIACEWIQSYGMVVGKEVFHTCRWVGRMQEAAVWPMKLVYRADVKMHLCNSTRAKDANVSQAIKDLYLASGGGKKPVIGTKAEPGPLYGVTSHMWAAFGLALTVQEAESLREIQ